MAFQVRELEDGFFTANGGMDSNIDPLLLKKDTFAFITNGTVRSNFVNTRSKYRKIPLDLNVTGLWQGGTYYKPDSDPECLVVLIAGRLFQITPATTTATVVERTITGDPNPDDLGKAWLWQAENFVIVQNSQSLPLFFDGQTTRRSRSSQALLGTVFLNFTVPPQYTVKNPDTSKVTVTLNANFLGDIDDGVTINGSNYQVVPGVGTYQATLTNDTDVIGTVHAIGTQIQINPNIFGVQATTVTFTNPGHVYSTHGISITLTLTSAYTGPVGVFLSVFGIKWKVTTVTGVFVLIQNEQSWTVPASLPAGTLILNYPGTLPITVVGKLQNTYTAPAISSSSTATLETEYTGVANQSVFLDGEKYRITGLPVTPEDITITLRNIDDTPGGTVIGNLDPTIASAVLAISELPPGRMGTYGMGRTWMALTDGQKFIASDIVGGASGTLRNSFRDAVLKIQENNYLAGGGFFTVPGSFGEIRYMKFVAAPDVSMGQGPLQVGSTNAVFSCNTPMERLAWQDVTNPILPPSLLSSGGLGQNSTLNVNGDIIFRSYRGIVSLTMARRDFNTWGNTPISAEVQTTLDADDVSLLNYGSAIVFNNRLFMTANPFPISLGVYHNKLIVLNFDPVSSLRGKEASVYDGIWDGLNVLQLFVGQFGSVERAFAFCLSADLTQIELWELLNDFSPLLASDTDAFTTTFETAAMFANSKEKSMFDLCRLQDGEIYVKDMVGTIQFRAWYRPDFETKWIPWHSFSVNGSVNSSQYRVRLGLGEPSPTPCDPVTNKPYREGYHFQMKFSMTVEAGGSCTFTGARFRAATIPSTKFTVPLCPALDPPPPTTPITGVRVSFRDGVYTFTWDDYPGVTCYNVYLGNSLVGECITTPVFTTTTACTGSNCYTIVPVTPSGEGPATDPILTPQQPPGGGGSSSPPPTIYYSIETTRTCTSNTFGLPVTIPTAAYTSVFSQADADNKADAAALAQLHCCPWSAWESIPGATTHTPGYVYKYQGQSGAWRAEPNYTQMVIYNASSVKLKYDLIPPINDTYISVWLYATYADAGTPNFQFSGGVWTNPPGGGMLPGQYYASNYVVTGWQPGGEATYPVTNLKAFIQVYGQAGYYTNAFTPTVVNTSIVKPNWDTWLVVVNGTAACP